MNTPNARSQGLNGSTSLRVIKFVRPRRLLQGSFTRREAGPCLGSHPSVCPIIVWHLYITIFGTEYPTALVQYWCQKNALTEEKHQFSSGPMMDMRGELLPNATA